MISTCLFHRSLRQQPAIWHTMHLQVSESPVSESPVSESTVSESTVSESTVSESTVSESTVSENAVCENVVCENALSPYLTNHRVFCIDVLVSNSKLRSSLQQQCCENAVCENVFWQTSKWQGSGSVIPKSGLKYVDCTCFI